MSQPITREEQYLSAMASGNSTDIKPVTREEMYLAKATGQSVAIPEPVTRKEVFLRDIALNGSGGGSVILKAFSATKNGKYNASDYGADGFSSVDVDVEAEGGSGGGTDDSIVGTWVFNDKLNFDGLEADKEYPIIFGISSGVTITTLAFRERYGGIYGLAYTFPFVGSLRTDFVYMTDTLWGMPAGWSGEVYKTITVFEEPKDDAIRAWIKTNGVKQDKLLNTIPSAYQLTSADELPTDAVDGSLAVVTEEGKVIGYTGTYILNDEITDLVYGVPESGVMFTVYWDSNNFVTYTKFGVSTTGSDDWGIYNLKYGDSTVVYTHNPDGNYGITHGWKDEAYKTIVVTEADQNALNWLTAHSALTEQGEPIISSTIHTLYSRENGEWVNKGEI